MDAIDIGRLKQTRYDKGKEGRRSMWWVTVGVQRGVASSKGVSALECRTGGWVGRSAAGRKKNFGTLYDIVQSWLLEVIFSIPAYKI